MIRENFGSSFRLHLITVVVIALAVPSLLAQKEKMPERLPSVNEIKQSLQREADTTAGAICIATTGPAPAGYYAGTNKCSSSNANYGSGNSINATVGTCSDKGGVEGTWAVGMDVAQVGLNYLFTDWCGGCIAAGTVENLNPDIYTPAVGLKFRDVTLKLTRNESIFGLEVNNTQTQNYTVTFHTTAGDVTSGRSLIGGESGLDPGAQHFIATCNVVAITGVTVHCDDCRLSSGPTAVAQIRGDKFPGF